MTMRYSRANRIRNTVLALDNSYRPMAEITRRKAIKAVVTRRADAVVNHKTFETSAWITSGQPLKMIIYRHSVKVPGEPRLHTGNKGLKAILRRDGYTCAYCGIKLKPSMSGHPSRATVDHIVPRAQGGQTSWGNLVASCFTCNQTKSSKTPDQAGMLLIRRPQSPTAILLEKLHRLVDE